MYDYTNFQMLLLLTLRFLAKTTTASPAGRALSQKTESKVSQGLLVVKILTAVASKT